MANMARNGTAGNATFNGFSVFQPALGATLQWLPQIGTPELDDMINAFLPGPASIQDKRAHISMDFFEYSRQTGESIKFYPVAMSATPATSPYDSGYASSFNASPVISEQSSWTQSPLTFAPFEEPAAAPRTASKKSSSSSPIDFANHPGMRIMTKDGRDVTNSASRGCKTKEQRDHAHLMRIIKACDACKRKKVRCDPSHRRRTGSQASSASPVETRPAKKSKKASKPAPAPAAPPPTTDSLAADAMMAPEMAFSSSSFDVVINADELDELWSQYVNFDHQQPVTVANDFSFDDFVFDSFTPSSASASSPSNVFPPSPAVVSDLSTEVSTQQDPALPYMNPDVALGTNYIDFNLYSPSSSFYDDDPVFFQRDVGSRHSPAVVNGTRGLLQELPQHVPGGAAAAAAAAPSPQSRLSATDQRSEYCEEYCAEYLHGCESGYSYRRTRHIAAGPASAQSTSSRSLSAGAENVGSAATHVSQSLVSPSSATRSGVAAGALGISPLIAGNVAGTVQSSGLPSSAIASSSPQSQSQIVGVTGAYGSQSRQDVVVNSHVAQSSVRRGTVVPVVDDKKSCSALQQCRDGLTAALTMILAWTLPVRRISAGGDGKEMQQLQLCPLPSLSQLVVSGLVSMFLSQINTNSLSVMVMAIALVSLAPIALQWCIGAAGPNSLQIPKPRAQSREIQSLIGRQGRNLLCSLDSASFRLR
ncbi:hypothetical protein QBC42DRAFT_9966 [Cladorrhinum samala]|uniref:Zn(2)-C6 fungal-type domain-containing protein n=1 Tax=Cladorrhinum samala TaxID=585594 RepID=A0AAV9HFF6_9PEZI|nr:hypothetical protein QBC42DRAFT_9966 [Cladorrhinum samala]